MRLFILFISLSLLLPTNTQAENKWEASLGQTQMFVGGIKGRSFPLPTVSSTIILSRSVYENFALWAIVNFPLSANKRLTSDGVLVEDQTPPVAMFGASYNILSHDLDEGKSLGFDIGLSLGRTIDLAGRYFPIGALRFKFLKDEGSTLYVGVTTSPYDTNGGMVWGVVYGMGYRF